MHDSALLRRYVDTGSDDAFAALVQSYLPLVYGAALRKVGGDTHLAQDVAQLAFVALAREAPRLRQHPDLAGWLFTSTRFLAANAVRTERRRRAREALVMAELLEDDLPVGGNARMQAMLDDVLMELQQLDRQILILRFYRGLRLAEIGAQINSTENAVQKRVERALERLRERFARIGITSAAAALLAALESHGAVAVPAGLKASAITAGLAAGGGGVVATASVGIAAAAKWALAAGAAAVLIGTVVLVGYRRENERLRTELASAGPKASAVPQGAPAQVAVGTGVSGQPTRPLPAPSRVGVDPISTLATTAPQSVGQSSPRVVSISGDLVPLAIEYPRPLFAGTPRPISLPNLEPPPSTEPEPIMVDRTTRLLSKGRPVASSDALPVIGELSFITDGDKSGRDGAYVELGPGVQWVQIDLGAPAVIDVVAVWHFHSQARVYHDVVILVSDDPRFGDPKKAVAIFNNDSDNSARLGLGPPYQRSYLETHRGKVLEAGAYGRYVRLYSNGNTSDAMNHYCEVEVFGRMPRSALRGK